MEARQQQGNGKGDADFMVVSRTNEGYRVYPAAHPSRLYLVSGNLNDLACTCDAFAEDETCEHVRAVQQQVGNDDRVEREERQAIQAEGQRVRKKKQKAATNNAPAVMTLKRSVSPDGRIDSLSVELSCPVEQVSVGEIKSRATDMLKLQSEITNGFLKTNGKQNGKGNGNHAERGTQNGSMPAMMLHVGSTNGRYGPRLFIAFQANGQGLKLFGTAKQLAQAVSEAGYQYGEQDIAEGIDLNLPCQVITKPSRDGRYTDIERVLPSNGSRPQQRGAS